MIYLQSNSTNIHKVGAELLVLLNELVNNKNQKKSDNFSEILIYCDSTNGEVYLYWFDPRAQETDDDGGYAIEFPELWEESNESDEGTSYFDGIISEAVDELAISDKGKNIFKKQIVLFQDENDEPRKV